jgi:purine-binding chemotaxis protein CheW
MKRTLGGALEKETTNGAARWDDLRAKLDAGARAFEEALDPPPGRARQILEARARELAKAHAVPSDEAQLDVMTFTLGAERYAIETRFVREVTRLGDLTPVPGAPDFIAGVTSLRGEIVAIADLRKSLGFADVRVSDASWILMLGQDATELGLLVDAVHEVRLLAASAVLAPADAVRGVGKAYVAGVTREALVILDGAALLGDERFFVDQGEEA